MSPKLSPLELPKKAEEFKFSQNYANINVFILYCCDDAGYDTYNSYQFNFLLKLLNSSYD